jgi:hypothetical protein
MIPLRGCNENSFNRSQKRGGSFAAAAFFVLFAFVFWLLNSYFLEKRRGGTNGTPNRSSRAADSHTTKRHNGWREGGTFQTSQTTKRHTQELRGAARFGRDERDGAARFTMAHNYHFVIRAAHSWRIVRPSDATIEKITFLRRLPRLKRHALTRFAMMI